MGRVVSWPCRYRSVRGLALALAGAGCSRFVFDADRVQPGAGDTAQLLQELREYEDLIKPHLLQEEIECLPLCRAYFTPKEMSVKIQEMVSHGPKVEMGSFIHASKSEIEAISYPFFLLLFPDLVWSSFLGLRS